MFDLRFWNAFRLLKIGFLKYFCQNFSAQCSKSKDLLTHTQAFGSSIALQLPPHLLILTVNG